MARIVLLGGGHAHVEVARRAAELTGAGHSVTLVSPAATHPYSGMGPGMLGGAYSLAEILLPVGALVRRAGGTFVQATAIAHDPDARLVILSTGETLAYDVLSLNIGSDPAHAPPARADHMHTVKPIRELARARAAIEAKCARDGACRIAVVGGGPAGVEVAANSAFLVKRLHARGTIDLYHSSDLLAHLDRRDSEWVRACLERHGIQVHTGARASPDDLDADIVFVASGIRPPEALATFGLRLAADGAVIVDEYLRSPDSDRVFAAGDCARFSPRPLERLGVYPVRMQRVLFANLAATADAVDATGGDARGALCEDRRVPITHAGPERGDAAGRGPHATAAELTPFTGTGPCLKGVNLGFRQGYLYRGAFRLRGRPAFRLKNTIDRRFIRQYR